MSKKTAVILVNWNSFEHTNNCILSLKKMSYTDYDIVVVDNGSKDRSGRELKRIHDFIILIESDENLGFTGGNNLGFNYACKNGYTYSILLNNDTFVEPDFLEILVAYMDNHPDTGAVQPRIYFNHNRNLLWNGGSYYNQLFGFTYSKGYWRKSNQQTNKIKEIDWVTGCAFFVRNSILMNIGYLAPNMFIYYEDVDLSFRIANSQYKLMYIPESVIYHIAGMSNKSKIKGKEGFLNPIVHYLNERNRIWLLKKYTPLWFVPTVLIFNFLYTIALMSYFAIRFRPKKLKAVIKAAVDGITGRIIYK